MFEIKKAAAADIAALVTLRIEVLIAANGLPEGSSLPEVEKNTAVFLSERFDNQVTLLAYDGADIAAVGSVCFYEIMPTCDCPSGKRAYIMNMYTRESRRRQGLATLILDRLVKETHERGITSIALEATDMGRGVYEKYGFVQADNEMLLP